MWREQLDKHPLSITTWTLDPSEINNAEGPVWVVGPKPSSWEDEAGADWKEVHSSDDVGDDKAQAYLLGTSEISLESLPQPKAIYCTALPLTLSSLRDCVRHCSQLVVPEDSESSSAPSSASSTLKSWLVEQSKAGASEHVYVSASDLLTALGEPIAPQPVFERGVQQLEEQLQSLNNEGWLQEVQHVSFNLKIHSLQKFKEIFLQDEPQLLDFFKAYEEMRVQLSTIDTLKLTLFKGRDFDLRDFAARLPYSVAELNDIFQQLHEKKLAVLDLHTAPQHQRVDPEFQLTLGQTHQASRSVELWSGCGEHRPSLVWASDVDEDNIVTQLPSEAAEFWEALQSKTSEAPEADTLLRWAGTALSQMEASDSLAAKSLWEWASAQLKVPGLGEEKVLELLPPAEAVTEEWKDVLQPLLNRYLNQDAPSKALYEYVLKLPEAFGFKTQVTGYLKAEKDSILSLYSAERHTAPIQQYLSVAKKESPTVTVEEPEESNEKSKGKKGRKKRASYQPQTWSIAAGWAEALQGHSRNAWLWVEMATPTTPREAFCAASIALEANQPVQGQTWLNEAKEGGQTIPPRLWSELYQQLFGICKAQARCKKCALQSTPFCPSGLQSLLELANQRPELSSENFEYTLAKRIRADLESNSTETLRSVLETSVAKDSERVQRAVLQQLASRDEATLEEYKRLAQWSEAYGDFKNALSFREKIKESEPNDPTNLQKLADLHLRQGEIQTALTLAMEATENHPRKFPLEIWVQKHHDALFLSLQALREALIDLPAHPILSALEEELTNVEETVKALKPRIEAAEAAMEAKNWGEAKELAENIVSEHPKHAPVHLQEMIQTITQHERRLWQKLKRMPRKPQERNQHLEALAEEAKSHGINKLVDAAFRKLLQFNPQYGLGYLKWGRTTSHPDRKAEAYEKAIPLSRSPQQARNNVDEYLNALADQGQLARAVPVLLEYARADESPVPKDYLEKIFLRMVKRYGTQEEISSPIREFLGTTDQGKSFKKVQSSLEQFDDMEPWKQALLSIKNKQK
ncbi:MAG: hypothetical protein EP343_09685 [Deltaproteobacteria bacterium]|nr:MAG: hypothetical protein EP343_09685 [Deltaproteobacteria bacterium]